MLPELQVVVTSEGQGRDQLGVAYGTRVTEARVRQDFQNVARELGQRAPVVKVTTEHGITAGSAPVPGVVDWSTGLVRLEPLLQAFRRAEFVRVIIVFNRPFPLAAPQPVEVAGFHVELRGDAQALDYLARRGEARRSYEAELAARAREAAIAAQGEQEELGRQLRARKWRAAALGFLAFGGTLLLFASLWWLRSRMANAHGGTQSAPAPESPGTTPSAGKEEP